MANKKHKTNVQAVKDMMEHSRFGMLSEMFVVEAIRRYAEACAAADPKDFESGFISGEAWHGVAKEISTKLDEHFAR
jgi:hypothetical protein